MESQVALTQAERPGSSIFNQPLKFLLAALGIAVAWGINPVSPNIPILVVIGLLLFLGIRRPVWSMAALLVSEMTVTSFMIPTPLGVSVSLRLLLVVIVAATLWLSRAQVRFDLGPRPRRIVVPALILVGLSLLSNLLSSSLGFALKDLRSILSGLLIAILLPSTVKNKADLKILLGVAFVGLTASAIGAIFQHYQIPGLGTVTTTPGFADRVVTGNRGAPGFSETQLEVSYLLSTSLLVIAGLYLSHGVNKGARAAMLLGAIPMAGGLYFAYTRSSIMALVFGVTAMVLFFRTGLRGWIVLSATLLVVIATEFWLPTGLILGGRSADIQLESTISRPILWQAGTAIALDNSVFGIGADRFLTVSPQYVNRVDPALIEWENDRYFTYRTLGTQRPHNDFLYVWVSYGTPALVVYLILFVAILQTLLHSFRSSRDRFVKGVAVGLAAALVAYATNAFYHNVMITLPLLWLLAGFSLAVAKLAYNRTSQTKNQADLTKAVH